MGTVLEVISLIFWIALFSGPHASYWAPPFMLFVAAATAILGVIVYASDPEEARLRSMLGMAGRE